MSQFWYLLTSNNEIQGNTGKRRSDLCIQSRTTLINLLTCSLLLKFIQFWDRFVYSAIICDFNYWNVQALHGNVAVKCNDFQMHIWCDPRMTNSARTWFVKENESRYTIFVIDVTILWKLMFLKNCISISVVYFVAFRTPPGYFLPANQYCIWWQMFPLN